MAKIILARVLKRKGLSKRQFAKLLGMDYANVFKFFRPGYSPRFSTMERWASVLKVKIRDLIDED